MFASQLQELPRAARQIPEILREIHFWKLLLAALPFFTYLLIFSSYKAFRHLTNLDDISPPNYVVLSTLEYSLFFCHPHKLLSQLANPVFDLLAAVPYLIHFPLPFLFMAYLILNPRKRQAVYPFIWCAGWVNLIAVLFQATFPTAPPWFTDSAVLDKQGNVLYERASEAGFKRLDALFGLSLFHGIYSQSPLKFGAFPSLHVAWPVVILLNHHWFGKKVAITHIVWISLAALYSTHHYLVDVLGGIALAVIVKLSMLKVWSPFAELDDTRTLSEDPNASLEEGPTKSYAPVCNGSVESIV